MSFSLTHSIQRKPEIFLSISISGSIDQLESTERSNGIVQDEPEVILETTEKIDVLFNRIKTATTKAAPIYGEALCQLTRDLVPPKELLTKVIKELLTISQPHCQVIARILFQVFRSAIDSSYLSVLQDWLLCSLPSFVALPGAKTFWCLTVIFVSSSINLQLVKIFPEIIERYDDLVLISMDEYRWIDDDIACRELFQVSSKDFYSRLSLEQRNIFRSIFEKVNSQETNLLLKTL